MVSKTPIRLVAIDEEPPDEDVTQIQDFMLDMNTSPTPTQGAEPAQDASPIRLSPEHEAITRRVPAAPDPAPDAIPVAGLVTGQARGSPKPARTWRRLVPLVVAVVLLAGLSIAWFVSRPARAPSGEIATSTAKREQASGTTAPVPMAAPRPTAPSPHGPNTPEVIRLQITAQPIQAELSLDGNVLAGHRLNLEVPKDRGIHVVSASAPGYFPVNQQVIFSNDIVLQIILRRSKGAVGRSASRQTPSPARAIPPTASKTPPSIPAPIEIKPQSSGRSLAAPRLEPGMDLDTPTPRRGAKSLDERNPYRP